MHSDLTFIHPSDEQVAMALLAAIVFLFAITEVLPHLFVPDTEDPMHDPDLPPCPRCNGDGYVPAVLYVDDYGDPQHGEVDCGTCGGSGNAPDPEQVAEYRATSAEYRAEMRQPVNPRR